MEEKNNEVVPVLEEQKMAFKPRVEPKGLLQKEEQPDMHCNRRSSMIWWRKKQCLGCPKYMR